MKNYFINDNNCKLFGVRSGIANAAKRGLVFSDSNSEFTDFRGIMKYSATEDDDGVLHIETKILILEGSSNEPIVY